MSLAKAARLPAVFLGHGTPLNAIEANPYADVWHKFGASLPKPKAILAVSAHWYTHGTAVTAMEEPRTIHDFGGFPQALFDVQYPAPGSPALAERVRDLLAPVEVHMDRSWGLDHGTWGVLVHAFPDADIPVVQLSIDGNQPAAYHYAIGKQLAPLRDEGVLIFGSGNVVHNLRTARRSGSATPYDWAVQFNDFTRDHVQRGDHAALIDYEKFGQAARMSIPTPEHYLPLLYVLGAQQDNDKVDILTDGIDLGSISMLSVAVGA